MNEYELLDKLKSIRDSLTEVLDMVKRTVDDEEKLEAYHELSLILDSIDSLIHRIEHYSIREDRVAKILRAIHGL